jgi:hypothetical protein
MSESYTIQADFGKTQDVALKIINAVGEEAVDYVSLASAMVMGRLANLDRQLEPEEEIGWIQAVMEFTDLYWAPIQGSGSVN